MSALSRRGGIGAFLLGLSLGFGAMFSACGDGGAADATSPDAVSRLLGGAIGIASQGSVQALELRLVLLETHSLEAGGAEGDVRLIESPAASLLNQLDSREVDAVLLSGAPAYGLLGDDNYEVLSHVSEDATKLLGQPVPESVLVTYPDAVERSGPSLAEVNRMLAESAAYFEANRSDALHAVSGDDESADDYQRWWWDRHDASYGDISEETQQQIVAFWQSAHRLGDIDAVPDLATSVFNADSSAGRSADRTTVSVAVLDEPSRRAALYALEQGLVSSDNVDIDVNYLSQLELEDAVTTKQYMVVEAAPLAVPRDRLGGSGLIVLSGGILDLDGAMLFVRRGR